MSFGRPTLQQAAAFCGRALLVAAFIAVAGFVVAKLSLVFIAIFAAILLTAMLAPLTEWLHRHKWPRGLASVACVLLFMGAIGGLIGWVVPQAVSQVREQGGDLMTRLDQGIQSLSQSLPMQPSNLEEATQRLSQAIRRNAQAIAGGVLSGAFQLVEALGGVALALVLAFFFLRDRHEFGRKGLRLFRPQHRPKVEAAVSRAWRTLGGWIRGAAVVALVDAVGIGAGLLIVGVPLALPLALLTFMGAFIPIVGATVTGALAVVVAWASGGTTDALIILAVVVAVQQLEGNVLEPFVLGRFVPLHPAVILIAVAVGALIAGIAGAFVAVPLAAATAAAISELSGIGDQVADPEDRSESDHPDEPQPDARH